MGRRARGTGSLNTKGYVQVRTAAGTKLEHVLVWEREHGPVPEGMQVHHKDENKQNNVIDNLELVDPTTHKRIHSGCELRDGVWWKPCRRCDTFKPVDRDHWYFDKNGRWPSLGRCKACHIRTVVERKRARRVAAVPGVRAV